MFLAGINYTLLYVFLIKGRLTFVWRDEELRLYILLLLATALGSTAILHYADGLAFTDALRSSFFNTLSLQTTTGFTDEDFMTWHPTVWLLLTFVGMFGACAGSTSGGLKLVRLLMLAKLVRAEFRQLLHPHAVLPTRISGTTVTAQMGRTLMVFFAVYLFLMLVSILAMVGMGHSLLDSFGLAISSFSNIGPTVGHEIGPLASWSSLSDGCLWLNSFLMLAGRLEIFSLLLPLTPAFWRDE